MFTPLSIMSLDYSSEIVLSSLQSEVSYKELKVLVVRPQVKDAGNSTLVETYWNFIFVLKRQTTQDL